MSDAYIKRITDNCDEFIRLFNEIVAAGKFDELSAYFNRPEVVEREYQLAMRLAYR